MSGNVYDELKERDFVAQVSDENALRKMLAVKPITFYVGFDSTASTPHRGRSQTWVRFPSRPGQSRIPLETKGFKGKRTARRRCDCDMQGLDLGTGNTI